MKSITTAILLLTSVFLHGQTTTEGSFTKIHIKGVAKVYVRQDSTCSVQFSDIDMSNKSVTKVSNDALVISGILTGDVHVTMPSLKEVTIEGQGSVNGENSFTTDNLKLSIDGDGKINLDANTQNIDADISGFGKIVLTGSAQDANFSIPGSGKIDAIGLKVIRAKVNIAGLGKVSVDAIDELNANISGQGTVNYKTLPKKVTENITGSGKVKSNDDDNSSSTEMRPDTTRFEFGKTQIWFIGKKDSTHTKKHNVRPIWQGFEMGVNSYLDNGGEFTLGPGKENWDLRLEKSISVGLNLFQTDVELGHSNVWLFTGLGITWNNYRFANNIVIDNGTVTSARVDSTPGIVYIKSKLVTSYITAPVMLEVFTSRDSKKAFHLGVGAMLGLRIGSHTKQKIEIDGDASKIKNFDDFNLNPFRYGFRASIGYGKFNIFADYYASTLFRENKGPVLYPVNVGITLIGI